MVGLLQCAVRGSEVGGQRVEASNQVVVELDQYSAPKPGAEMRCAKFPTGVGFAAWL